MSESKPKIEGRPRFPRRPARNVGVTRKEFVTKKCKISSEISEVSGCDS